MFLNMLKINWRKIVGVPLTGLLFIVSCIGLLYASNILGAKVETDINFYWWVEIFKNKKLTYLQFFIYNNVVLIFYILNYISIFIAIVWVIFQKDKSVLSLMLFVILVGFGLSVNNIYTSIDGATDFQMIFMMLQKYSLLFILGNFMYQVFSKYYERNNQLGSVVHN